MRLDIKYISRCTCFLTSSCEVGALKVNKTVQHDTNLVLGRFKDYCSNKSP